MSVIPHAAVANARDFLLEHRLDYEGAVAGFVWPKLETFNFATDWFDVVARERDREALRVVFDDGRVESSRYSELSDASKRIANFLRQAGVARGDAILLMLGNVTELWQSILAITRLGAVMIPAPPLLSRSDLRARMQRGDVRFVIADGDYADRFDHEQDQGWRGIAVGRAVDGWLRFEDALTASPDFMSETTKATDPLLLYFTSGTTAAPKLVLHSQQSYPVGHLSTLYWLGLQPGDVHLNISSPGWAKHAWSCVFAPWLAEATALVINAARFDARQTLDIIAREKATTFCAPPTVWRMLIQQDLKSWDVCLREAAAAGEPLNPEVMKVVGEAWSLIIRDGFGQTETSALVGNSPGQPVKPGSLGRPMPGFDIAILDLDGEEVAEGEVAIRLGSVRPIGLMQGYSADGRIVPIEGEFYRTGDVALRDPEGVFTYVGRADDVFKASDYRISPFELESVLIQHAAVVEAAVVPSPDPQRLAVPKAFVSLAPGVEPSADTARSILEHAREVLGPFKRVRRIEVIELPKTISGKIRRVELRRLEAERRSRNERGEFEWVEEDFTSGVHIARSGHDESSGS